MEPQLVNLGYMFFFYFFNYIGICKKTCSFGLTDIYCMIRNLTKVVYLYHFCVIFIKFQIVNMRV